jgi:hypothetical protein
MRRSNKSSQTKGRLIWRRPSPMFVEGTVAAFLGLLLLTAPALKRFFSDHLTPRISFDQGRARRESDGVTQSQKPTTTMIFDGEVYRTEGRLREASAVAIAATLSGVASLTERRPIHNVSELLQDIARRGLLPPGVELAPDRNLLVSEHSRVHVRLRAEPFAVEILSIGRERLDGAALLLRVPDGLQNKNEPARYFYSLKLEDVRVPDPFAIPSAVLACGWQMGTIRPSTPTEGASEAQLTAWANEQRSK